MSIHRFYINPDDIDGNIATITGQDAKHLVNVLRLGSGNSVELADGHGNHYMAEIEAATSKQVIFKIISKRFLDAESPAHITIAQGMLKDKKMDVILRHLTELGIKEWIPFFASRSVPCPDAIQRKEADFAIPKSYSNRKTTDVRVERWERIARESIKQCGRSLLPIVHQPMSYDKMINEAECYDEKIAFWEKSTIPVDAIRERLSNIPSVGEQRKIIVMVGPEGGFSEQEISIALKNGFQSFSLGKRILRAETASIAACTLVQNIFGDI
ncbi:MAG: 16S rRNA (uracil(1498)-N(3))-methyltransferase [Desulfamplus sp.]|nr:16S rRNA (uracil(1498)-N(3))-methyltransferase [Desulfamplus sp.]